ncbi:RDD family protein, partial [Stenotrophomonas maltophilia]
MSRPATDTATAATTEMPRPRALLLWRMLAMVYDTLPVLALWMLAGTLFTLAYTLDGHTQRENIAPFSAWQWLLWAVCWAITGWYATASWRRGGQTLGMRPWRL